jgi:hypothetical protein
MDVDNSFDPQQNRSGTPSVESVAKSHPRLVTEFRNLEPVATAASFAALLTVRLPRAEFCWRQRFVSARHRLAQRLGGLISLDLWRCQCSHITSGAGPTLCIGEPLNLGSGSRLLATCTWFTRSCMVYDPFGRSVAEKDIDRARGSYDTLYRAEAPRRSVADVFETSFVEAFRSTRRKTQPSHSHQD